MTPEKTLMKKRNQVTPMSCSPTTLSILSRDKPKSTKCISNKTQVQANKLHKSRKMMFNYRNPINQVKASM